MSVEQQVSVVAGNLVGLSVNRLVTEDRLLDLSNLQYLALVDPAILLARTEPRARIVVLVDAIDELRYQSSGESILDWLARARNSLATSGSYSPPARTRNSSGRS